VTNQYIHDLKLYRALQHIERLEVEVERWLGGYPYSLTVEFDPERSENCIWINPLRKPPIEFSLIIGERLHNLRSALDSLVYALAIRNQGDRCRTTLREGYSSRLPRRLRASKGSRAISG
jgi:hypothetical protein